MRNLSRRSMLQLAVPGALLPTASFAQSSLKATSTFVLIHGAWHGGWCWRRVVPLLRAAGHEVLTPTLTGMGERSHLLSPGVDLTLHIRDIVAVLEYEDLQDVVLVGHSYGGMVIAGVGNEATSRIQQLVYLDAFLPEDGKSLTDYFGAPPTLRDDGWRVAPLGSATARFGVTNANDLAWLERRLSDQPLRTFTQPVALPGNRVSAIPGTYIQISRGGAFAAAAGRARTMGYRHVDMPGAAHDAMITRPVELAEVLLGVVRTPA